METLSELGVLFLLYEQGLELSLDRLKVCGWFSYTRVGTQGDPCGRCRQAQHFVWAVAVGCCGRHARDSVCVHPGCTAQVPQTLHHGAVHT